MNFCSLDAVILLSWPRTYDVIGTAVEVYTILKVATLRVEL